MALALRLAAAACEAACWWVIACGCAWRFTPARHCASCASADVEVAASRSPRMIDTPAEAFFAIGSRGVGRVPFVGSWVSCAAAGPKIPALRWAWL